MEDCKPYGRYQGWPYPGGTQLAKATLFLALYLFYLADFVHCHFLAAVAPQHIPGIVLATSAQEPARCLQHKYMLTSRTSEGITASPSIQRHAPASASKAFTI